MKLRILKFIVAVIILNLGLNGATAQESVDSDRIYFSDKLKAGMEFTWEIVKFNFDFNYSEALELHQTTTTSAFVSTVSDEATTVTVTKTRDSSEDPDFPNIKPGTKYTLKLLRDLGNLTESNFWDEYYTNQQGYFEHSFSDPSIDSSEDGFGPSGFISPNTIRFNNGTVRNYFEYLLDLRNEFDEDFLDDEQFLFWIEGGILIEEINFSDEDGTIQIRSRTDVETGVMIFTSIFQNTTQKFRDVEIKLAQTKGIKIDNLNANNDPTLSIPISAFFVYALILIPIISRQLRRSANYD